MVLSPVLSLPRLYPCCLSLLQNIPTFLKSFSGEVDVSEALEPIDSFKCFNEVGMLVLSAAGPTCARSVNGIVSKDSIDGTSLCTASNFRGHAIVIPGGQVPQT